MTELLMQKMRLTGIRFITLLSLPISGLAYITLWNLESGAALQARQTNK